MEYLSQEFSEAISHFVKGGRKKKSKEIAITMKAPKGWKKKGSPPQKQQHVNLPTKTKEMYGKLNKDISTYLSSVHAKAITIESEDEPHAKSFILHGKCVPIVTIKAQDALRNPPNLADNWVIVSSFFQGNLPPLLPELIAFKKPMGR